MKITRSLVLAIGVMLGSAAAAAAQSADPKGYVDLNAGGQVQSVTVSTASTFQLFGETGGASSTQTVGNGLVFDIGGGYVVWKNLAVGVAVSLFTRSPIGTVSIATPDPIAFQSFTVVSQSPALKTTELGTHIRLAYLLRITDKIGATLYAGPSFMKLNKQIASAVVANGTGQIVIATETGSSVGVHGGADLAYLFTKQIGAGVYVRYIGASVDLPSAAGINVGGFQSGLGIRLRF